VLMKSLKRAGSVEARAGRAAASDCILKTPVGRVSLPTRRRLASVHAEGARNSERSREKRARPE
jgi:hypothetical protein